MHLITVVPGVECTRAVQDILLIYIYIFFFWRGARERRKGIEKGPLVAFRKVQNPVFNTPLDAFTGKSP